MYSLARWGCPDAYAVMDNLAFDLIFKDEINHFKTLNSSIGEPV